MTLHESFALTGASVQRSGGARGTLRSLDIAARSVFESQALSGDIATVVAERALDHHWAGLFQFAAIRCGASNAAPLLEQLELEARAVSTADEDEVYGPGARLYRALRTRLSSVDGDPLTADADEWWVPLDTKLAARAVALREELPPVDAEFLELRYARGLTLEEVAHVTDTTIPELERRRDSALALADRVLGRHRPQGITRDAALVQVFALDPRRIRVPQRRSRKPVLSVGTVIGKRYEIEALLGAGAFADVYRARDREVTDHVVALKILRRPAGDAEAVRTALRELQLIASVFHPSIVQLKDHGWHEGHLWFVMPLYRGETLAKRLRRGPLNRPEAREIFEQLAEALATMHVSGVRHQDIKPENVFLAKIDPEGGTESRRILPVLLDLGVAAKDAELVLAGTPAYFAPEVAARFAGVPDPPPVGPKADVFSLALTLRYALDPSPEHDVAAAAVDAFVSFRATHAPAGPRRRDLRDLAAPFARWLNLSPDARPSADEFRRELALLTHADEQRARRLGLMRWMLPTAVALLTVFGGVVHVLSGEASYQRMEAEQARLGADRARERAASIHATLEEEEARRRQLEADVQRLTQEYRNNTLTRDQLAGRLAEIESEFAVVTEREKAQGQRLRQQTDTLRDLREQHAALTARSDALSARRNELAAELDRFRNTLDGERARRSEAESRLETLSLQLKAAELVVDDSRSRIVELESRLAELQRPRSAAAP